MTNLTVMIVFLDLPSPWLALGHAIKSLRRDQRSRIGCFSPCMEQVQRTLAEMNTLGLLDLELFECLAVPHETEYITLRPPPPFRGNPSLEADMDFDKKETDNSPIEKTVVNHTSNFVVTRNEPMMKGHTSYLYFASLPPL